MEAAPERPAIPGLRLRDQISLSERGGRSAEFLAAGMTDASGPALLPKSFLEQLDAPPPRDDAVKVGELQAYRYQDLRPEGSDGRLTLLRHSHHRGSGHRCLQLTGLGVRIPPLLRDLAAGLKLINGEAFPLGTDEKYVGRLDETIDRLNADRSRGVKKLRTAKKQSGQATAAESIAAATSGPGRRSAGSQ